MTWSTSEYLSRTTGRIQKGARARDRGEEGAVDGPRGTHGTCPYYSRMLLDSSLDGGNNRLWGGYTEGCVYRIEQNIPVVLVLPERIQKKQKLIVAIGFTCNEPRNMRNHFCSSLSCCKYANKWTTVPYTWNIHTCIGQQNMEKNRKSEVSPANDAANCRLEAQGVHG